MRKAICLASIVLAAAPALAEWSWTTLDISAPDYIGSITPYGIEGNTVLGNCSAYGYWWEGFSYDGSTFRELSFPGEVFDTAAEDISGTSIVGGYSGDGSHGFVYDETGWRTLDYPEAYATTATSIDGGTIGGCYQTGSDSGPVHGFSYDNGMWRTLDFPGAKSTRINGLDDGTFAGEYIDAAGRRHGFTYDGHAWEAVDAPGALGTEITGVSGNLLIGSYYASPAGHKFLYDGTTWTLLDSFNDHGTVWTITSLDGISGNNIVGQAYSSTGIPRVFILTVPEPASLVLLLPSLPAWARRRRPFTGV